MFNIAEDFLSNVHVSDFFQYDGLQMTFWPCKPRSERGEFKCMGIVLTEVRTFFASNSNSRTALNTFFVLKYFRVIYNIYRFQELRTLHAQVLCIILSASMFAQLRHKISDFHLS